MTDDPERRLPLDGATNFRDLGGYRGHDQRPLRWRRLFRSDHLGNLSDADRRALAQLGVKRAFDFRGVQERAAATYDLPGLQQHSLAIEPSVAQRMTDLVQAGVVLDAAHMTELMHELYERLVDDNAARYAEWFEHLLADDSPLVFHCTAGKDRTGVAAALLLAALGVPRPVIEHDFLLTNQHYRRPVITSAVIPEDALAVLWGVRPSFLHTALETIEKRLGGLEGYLGKQMKLTPAARARLAASYLEP
ncbi:MAG: tyrosine-protein phosphatase [Rubrivivax sp.]